MICPYCKSEITISTSYSVPVVTRATKHTAYGREAKAAGVSTAYSCKRDECRRQLQQAHGVKAL